MSTGDTAIPSVYARALLEAAGDDAPTVAHELGELVRAVTDSAEGADAWAQLTAPQVSPEVRIATLDKLLASGARLTRNFLHVLVENRRFDQLPDIYAAFRELVQARENQLDVRITSAIELPDTLRSALEERLSASTGKQVTLHTSVDPAIIGGLVVQHGDTLVDTSLRSRLEQLRLQLTRPASQSSSSSSSSTSTPDNS